MNSARSTRRLVLKSVGVVEAAGFLAALLYFTGYFINSIFVRNYGIPEPELFRLEYVKIGFTFWLIAGGMVLIPFGAFFLTHHVRRSSGLPHFLMGWIGNSLNTTIMLGVPLALAFFATRFEWYLRLQHSVAFIETFNVAVGWGLALSVFGTVCVPFLERLALWSTTGATRLWVFRILIEPLRFGCLIVSVLLIAYAIRQVPWLSIVFGRAGSFIAVSVIFMIGLIAAAYWVRHIEVVRGTATVFLLIGFGLCFFYYLSITSYVFGLYPAIPSNRGGGMPLSEAYFETSGHDSLFSRERQMPGFVLRGPVYILEQSSDTIYFVSEGMEDWFERFIPVHALAKSAVPYIRFQRIEDGFPRVKRPRPQSAP